MKNPSDNVFRMRLTVLGGCGAWPEAGKACSGYLVEHDGFRLVVDFGYATLPRLLQRITADQVDAVFISHGHPDHCADLNPLLRARALRDDPSAPLSVYALPGALDAVFALDRPGMLAGAYVLHAFSAGSEFDIGPFRARTRLLPHWVPNAGVRLAAGDRVLAYTGDSGPSPDVVKLGREADLLLAEATYVNQVPDHSQRYLSSARQAARHAADAGAGHLLLTHLWPGTDHAAARAAASDAYDGEVAVADADLVLDLP
jgi:ribonuclease BN (tRNA processing enzyme)